ncbi:S-layer homology domain-containing protein [Paenibacillus tepidiphilus]|uniref:S-layer homology domain-containing protein n=1 Tax=Paenibacillus tepidiphilus TaxID=2608683 RepID=UPI00123C54C8|nr:S-layer homology domain-containing protein [Paenibacillus tepidiphilus]
MSGQKKLKPTLKSYTSKVASAALAGAMVFGGAGAAFADTAAAAQTSQTAQSTQTTTTAAPAGAFSDVKTGFWAEKHIYKLAAQGIVVGNNGLFRPGDSVTQQEAVLMALRFMKLTGNVDTSTNVVLPANFEVSNYYKPYVVLALQQGLLDKSTEMAESNLKTAWGTRKASREWVAELLVRSLGKTADASSVATLPTGFADDAKVSASKRGYINTAVKLGLANGLDGNRFDPQGAVTRAQLATFLSRAEAQHSIVYDNTVSGTISSLQGNQMKVYHNGAESTFNLGAGTAYFTSASETRISLGDLKPYTKVTVIGATYNAAYVEVTDGTVQLETLEGTFAKIAQGTIWLDTPAGYDQYVYDANTVFVDVNGATITPVSIAADSKVSLQRETYSGDRKLVKVQVTSGIVNKTAAGTIQSIDLATKSLTFKTASGTSETFKWEDGAAIFKAQSSVLQASDLKVGAAVNYTIKNNMILSVDVTSGTERVVEGLLNEVTNSSLVYKKADGTREAKLLANLPAVVIPEITGATINDLMADAKSGDTVRLTLNSSDQVTRIEVIARKVVQHTGASVLSYNSKTLMLTYMDSAGKAHLVQLDKDTKLAYDGVAAPSLEGIATRLTEGRKVNVTALEERAQLVEISTQYTGTLTSSSVPTNTFVLKLAGNQSLTLPLPQSVDLFGKKTATISDIPVGSQVTAYLGGNQSIVTIVRAVSSAQLQITAVNAANNQLTVTGTAGNFVFNTLAVKLLNEAGQSITLSDLKAGDYINVNFLGSNPTSIQAVKVSAGAVTAVDAAAGTLTVKDYAGATQTLSVGTAVKIVRDGATATSLSSLTTADRVEVRKDVDGSTTIRVFAQQSKVFWKMDGSSLLLAKRSSASDTNYQFTLSPNVYIHQGDTTLSVQSLKENDNIIMYLHNNVVVEIVKQ